MTIFRLLAIVVSLWGILVATPVQAEGRRERRERDRGGESYRGHRGGGRSTRSWYGRDESRDRRHSDAWPRQNWGYGSTWPDYNRPTDGYYPYRSSFSPSYRTGSSDPCDRYDVTAIGRDGGRLIGEAAHLSRSGRAKADLIGFGVGLILDPIITKRCRDRLERERLDRSRQVEVAPREERRVTVWEDAPRRDVERNVAMFIPDRPTAKATRVLVNNCTSQDLQLFRGDQPLTIYVTSDGDRTIGEWLAPGQVAWVEGPATKSVVGIGPLGVAPATLGDDGALWVFDPQS